jgi:hypothetical protein
MNVLIAMWDPEAKGFNITRLKFTTHSVGLILIGLAVLIAGIIT